MKTSRAIEILEKEEEDTWMGTEREWKQAVKLGYEALNRIEKDRKGTFAIPLPSETVDEDGLVLK